MKTEKYDPYREVGMDHKFTEHPKVPLKDRIREALKKTGHIAEDKLDSVTNSVGEAIGESLFSGNR